jgi:hypothetical protein
MSYPSCKKQDRGGGGKISRALRDGIAVHQIPYMVQCHDHHHKAPNNINGNYPFHRLPNILSLFEWQYEYQKLKLDKQLNKSPATVPKARARM